MSSAAIMSRNWRVAIMSAVLLLSTSLLVTSFFIPLPVNQYKSSVDHSRSNGMQSILLRSPSDWLRLNGRLYGAQMLEFDFEDEDQDDPNDTRTDEEKGLTHGYEGDFKVGDIVKIKSDIRIWSVKQHAKEGFMCKDFEGTVVSMALYGRKEKALCSAITPVRVQFEVDGKGIPAGFFERKWIAHFAGEELELISKAPAPIPGPEA